MADKTRIEGTLKWYNGVKGYGFLLSEGKDYFFHYKELQVEKLVKNRLSDFGQDDNVEVTFEPALGARGRYAKAVRLAHALPSEPLKA